jgi:hypothetical protein
LATKRRIKITIRGVRGSIPTTSPDTKYYGGNTSSTDVSEDGCMLVLDAGIISAKYLLLLVLSLGK